MTETRGRCLTEKEIADVVDGKATAAEAKHLTSCRRCRNTCDLVAELIRLHDNSAAEARQAFERVRALGRHRAKRIESEAPAHQWQFVATRFGASPSIVLAMLDRFEELMDVASPDTVSMADAAVNLAFYTVDLVGEQDGASLRCRAWKARAVALAYFCSYAEADAALEEAAQSAHDIVDVASVAYARAWLYGNPDVWRPAEALEIIEKHLPMFEQVGPDRYRAARMLRIGVMMRAGELANAEAELLALGKISETPIEHAMVAANRAYCRLGLGNPQESLRLGRQAASVYRSLGSSAKILLLQTEWTIARSLGASGDTDGGLVIARRVADEFTRLSLEEHAVRAELTSVRLTLTSDPTADVEQACERILVLCSRWPGPRAPYAAEALLYLREMALRRAATLDDALSVETYIDGLRTSQPLRFRPPIPLATM